MSEKNSLIKLPGRRKYIYFLYRWNSKHDALEKNDLNKRFLWIRFFRVGFCCNFIKLLRRNTDKNRGRGSHIRGPKLKVLNRMIGVSLTPHAE